MTATINVFNMPQVVTLTLGGDTGATLMNYPVNRTDFKLAKGVTTEIMFFVKDTDRHPITVSGLANAGIVGLRLIVTDIDDNVLLLGSQNSTTTTYTISQGETVTTYSNSAMFTSNTVTISSTSNSSGSNSIVSNTTMTTVLTVSPGAGDYVVPDFVNAIVVETWGPGGAGVLSPETGAGGGAYALKNFTVTSGETFPFFVGNSSAPEKATFWGNSTDHNAATFGAFGGAWVANNVTDVSAQLGSPFGAYDVGYYGAPPITGQLDGRASAWSGGNASTNPAGVNVSTIEGGGQSNGVVGTSPGGGAPASISNSTMYGGNGQLRITEYYDQEAIANAIANAQSNSNSISNTVTSNSNVTTNSVTITNTVTTSVTYFSNVVTLDPSVLVPAPGIDPAKGVWMLRLKATDIVDWPLGFLRYSVIADRIGGDQVMLYTDRGYGPYSSLLVIDGPFPMPNEATNVTANSMVMLGQSLQSGAYAGPAQVRNLSGLSSVVYHMGGVGDGFTGSVTIQGSLDNSISQNDADWMPVEITDSTGQGTISGGTITFNTPPTLTDFNVTVRGNYMWLRFIVTEMTIGAKAFTSLDFRAD
jgi:hypothetical protein